MAEWFNNRIHISKLSYIGLVLLTLWLLPTTVKAVSPAGVPTETTEARVWGYIDGDKFKVRIGDKTEVLNTIGADAPEMDKGLLGECFANEAGQALRQLLPKKTTVYLETDSKDRDSKDRLLSYVWVLGPNDNNSGDTTPFLLNEWLIHEGFASFKSKDDNTRYDKQFERAQADAKKHKRGLWKTCGAAHVELTPTSTANAKKEPTSEPESNITFQGSGMTTLIEPLKAGTYSVDAKCSTDVMFVYLYDAAGNDLAMPVSMDLMGDDSPDQTTVPVTNNYILEVYCDGVWSMVFNS